MRLFSFRLNILTSCLFHLSDDQLLHFPSLLLLPFSSTYIILYILYLLITSYNYKTVLLTYFLHTFCIVLNNLHLSNLLRSSGHRLLEAVRGQSSALLKNKVARP